MKKAAILLAADPATTIVPTSSPAFLSAIMASYQRATVETLPVPTTLGYQQTLKKANDLIKSMGGGAIPAPMTTNEVAEAIKAQTRAVERIAADAERLRIIDSLCTTPHGTIDAALHYVLHQQKGVRRLLLGRNQ